MQTLLVAAVLTIPINVLKLITRQTHCIKPAKGELFLLAASCHILLKLYKFRTTHPRPKPASTTVQVWKSGNLNV